MDLYLLRHGIAVERGSGGDANDAGRPLTARGERRVVRIARGMRALGLAFDLLLTSPYVRAARTAEIVARTLRAKNRLRVTEHLASDGDPRALVREIAGSKPVPDRVLLVGHEPYLGRLISTLTTGDGDLDLTLKKGGLCRLTAESLKFGRCATLRWVLTPAHLARM